MNGYRRVGEVGHLCSLTHATSIFFLLLCYVIIVNHSFIATCLAASRQDLFWPVRLVDNMVLINQSMVYRQLTC